MLRNQCLWPDLGIKLRTYKARGRGTLADMGIRGCTITQGCSFLEKSGIIGIQYLGNNGY